MQYVRQNDSKDVKPDDPFIQFREYFKVYEEGKEFQELFIQPVIFDSTSIEIHDYHNPEIIAKQLSEIPSKLFRLHMILNSQVQIVQILEDAYKRWHAEKYIAVDEEKEEKIDRKGTIFLKRIERTENAKENIIITKFAEEYTNHQEVIRQEKYKLNIMKTAVNSMENYSFKLHSLYKNFERELNPALNHNPNMQ